MAVILRMEVASLGLAIAFRACIPGVRRAARPSLSRAYEHMRSSVNRLKARDSLDSLFLDRTPTSRRQGWVN